MLHKILGFLKSLTDTATLEAWTIDMGFWFYGLMFLIVFAETGLVVTPFLPGDSLLFAVGAVCAGPSGRLSFPLVFATMLVAAVLGDAVNYAIGKRVGPRVFTNDSSRFLKKEHLLKAQAFYERYGGKAIVLARFVPIVRTFAPFVAGIGSMPYSRFAFFNIFGGFLWVLICMGAGHLFGRLEAVQKHFELVLIAIIVISILPMAVEILRARARKRAESAP